MACSWGPRFLQILQGLSFLSLVLLCPFYHYHLSFVNLACSGCSSCDSLELSQPQCWVSNPSSLICLAFSFMSGNAWCYTSLELWIPGSCSLTKWCYTGSFREGIRLFQLHASKKTNNLCNVILCKQCLPIPALILLCSKTKSLQMFILQYKMSCVFWLSNVLWPLVMDKDFGYSIFKQQCFFLGQTINLMAPMTIKTKKIIQ